MLNAGEFSDGKAHRIADAAQLPLLPLFERDSHQRFIRLRGEDAQAVRFEEIPSVMDAAEHLPLDFGSDASFAEDHIDLWDLVGWVSEFLDEVAVICEQEQSLRFAVEPPHVPERAEFLWKQLVDGVGCMSVGCGAGVSGWFVEEDAGLLFWWSRDLFPVQKHDVLVRIHQKCRGGEDLSVDGNASLQDPLLRLAAGGDARGGEEFCDALRGCHLRMERIFSARDWMRYGFWRKPAAPFSRTSSTSCELTYPLVRRTLTSGEIFLS